MLCVFQKAKQRQQQDLPNFMDFPELVNLRNDPLTSRMGDLMPGEKDIVVVDKLQRDRQNRYQLNGGPWVHYDVLMGDVVTKDVTLSEQLLQRLDREIALKVR